MVLSFLWCAKDNLREVFVYLENQEEDTEVQLAKKQRFLGKSQLRREKASIESFMEEIEKLINEIENHIKFFKSHELPQKQNKQKLLKIYVVFVCVTQPNLWIA